MENYHKRELSYERISSALEGSTKIARRNCMREAQVQGQQGFYYGPAVQSVFRNENDQLILSEAKFDYAGYFLTRHVVIDLGSETAVAWEGEAVNNPDHEGHIWELGAVEYNAAIMTSEELIRKYHVPAT